MAAVCVALHTHTHQPTLKEAAHTHVPNSHSCTLPPSLELPSLWWRHFDSLPLLFLCYQFYFCRQQCWCSMAGNTETERKRVSDHDWYYIRVTQVRSGLLIWVTEVCVEERVLSEPVSGFPIPCRPLNVAVELLATFAEQWKLEY